MLDGLNYNDSVVDNETDSQNHGEKADGVDGKAHEDEGTEGTDERYRNCQHGDEGSPPAAQENINNYKNEDEGLKEGMGNLGERFLDELTVILEDTQLHIRRQTSLSILNYLSDTVSRFDSICIGSNSYGEGNGFTIVNF